MTFIKFKYLHYRIASIIAFLYAINSCMFEDFYALDKSHMAKVTKLPMVRFRKVKSIRENFFACLKILSFRSNPKNSRHSRGKSPLEFFNYSCFASYPPRLKNKIESFVLYCFICCQS